jgi:hypothetical protein
VSGRWVRAAAALAALDDSLKGIWRVISFLAVVPVRWVVKLLDEFVYLFRCALRSLMAGFVLVDRRSGHDFVNLSLVYLLPCSVFETDTFLSLLAKSAERGIPLLSGG